MTTEKNAPLLTPYYPPGGEIRSWGKYEPRTSPDPGEQFKTALGISGALRQLPVMAQRNALLAAFHRAPHHGDPHGEPSGSPMKKPALERGQLSPAGTPILIPAHAMAGKTHLHLERTAAPGYTSGHPYPWQPPGDPARPLTDDVGSAKKIRRANKGVGVE
ncbi:hypothetical protein ES703_110905 [subsurface metagenome]